MTIGFGTENLVFTPPGGRLVIWDVYRWRRLSLDVTRSYARMRANGVGVVEQAVNEAVAKIGRSRKTTAQEAAACRDAAEKALADVRSWTGPDARSHPHDDDPASFGATWWVRFSDRPQESFFEEDYDEAGTCEGRAVAYPVYGSLASERLQELEVPLPGRKADAPIWLMLPEEGGVEAPPIGDDEPLPLVHEYCGAGGASSRGASVNVHFRGDLAAEHMGAIPMRRVGGSLFATLYFHLSVPSDIPVMARLSPRQVRVVLDALARSHFAEAAGGDTWGIYRRDRDFVHIYDGLEGRESEGVDRMPPFVMVAKADGETTPEARGALLAQILQIVE